jgi:hypothetical protein
MQEAALSPLAPWQNFYVIIGSAAATLTGLLFVVITLSAGVRVRVSSPGGTIRAFSTPNVVHFCAALLVAAILSAPWQALWHAGLLLGLAGLGGGDLCDHRAPAGTPSDRLSTGALRLAVAHCLSAGFLHRPPRRGDAAPRSSGTGTIRHRRGNGAAPVHRHPQRLG